MSIEWQPYIYPHVITKEHNREFLLINADFGDWVRLGEDEYTIFTKFQQRESTEEVIEEVRREKGMSLKEAIKSVKKVLGRLVLSQIVFSSPDPEIAYYQRVPTLEEVYIAVTHQCNLSCPYCYADAGEAFPQELTTQEMKGIIYDGERLGCRKVVFTGGEPLLRRDLFEVAFYAQELGFETEVLTNGILVNRSNIRRIAEAFDYVGVSLDGSNQEIHEQLRGPDTFNKTLSGIALLAENGINVSLNTVVTCLNFRDIPNIARLAHSFNSIAYQTHQHIPIGRGVRDELSCSFKEMEEMRHLLVKTFSMYPEEPFVRERIENNHPLKKTLRERCGTGRSELIIDSKGDLYPCRMLQTKECRAGNIRERPLYELYETSEVLKYCQDLGLHHLDCCRGCEVLNLCAGGCRAYHYAFTEDLFTNHPPLCELLKEELYTNIWLKTGYFPCKNEGG